MTDWTACRFLSPEGFHKIERAGLVRGPAAEPAGACAFLTIGHHPSRMGRSPVPSSEGVHATRDWVSFVLAWLENVS